MQEVYSFVEASDSFREKVRALEDTIGNILKQTVECAIFIREYTGQGFGGDHYMCTSCFRSLMAPQADSLTRRLVILDRRSPNYLKRLPH
jgi:hypothetical protein